MSASATMCTRAMGASRDLTCLASVWRVNASAGWMNQELICQQSVKMLPEQVTVWGDTPV